MQQGKVALNEFMQKGKWQFDLKPGDNYSFIAYKKFIDDPEANPLKTATGKFEIYSEAYAHDINKLLYSTIDPLPTYIPGLRGYEDSFSDWENKVKGEFPYQVASIHYLGRAHTSFSNCAWTQEAFPAPVYMNTGDAKDNGIAEGDTVLLESKDGGRILRSACVTECMMPGQMAIEHGSWKDMNSEGIDIGGSENTLGATPPTGFGVGAYNSMLVKVSKYSGAPLIPDCEKPRRVLVED